MSVLRKALHERQFVCVVEYAAKSAPEHTTEFERLLQRSQLCGWPLTVAIGDRVGSSLNLTSLEAFARLARPVAALLHFSGKDRERQDLLAQLERMDVVGLDQLLLLSGDRLPGHQPGQKPVRYLESVPALQIVRQARPAWLLGAALNPFKYHEEEGEAQYFKAKKKLAAGADFLTLQLGFDAQKHLEAMQWMKRQARPIPLIACVMSITHSRALIFERVAGITITPSMRDVLAAEEAVSAAHALKSSVDRLALQIIGLQLMGYAGIHLSGIHAPEQLEALEQIIDTRRTEIQSLEQWFATWEGSWKITGLPAVTFSPPGAEWHLGESRISAGGKERLRYHLLSGFHSLLFSRGNALSRAFGWAVRRSFWSTPRGSRWLHRLERGLKRPVLGCDTCGNCRLEATLYICPETCPKGLANGPCGGTRLNRCEFGDRECIHSVKYRTAKAVGQTRVLTDRLIPCVEISSRQESSWPRWFEIRSAEQELPEGDSSRLKAERSRDLAGVAFKDDTPSRDPSRHFEHDGEAR